jgi:hypothetical protein
VGRQISTAIRGLLKISGAPLTAKVDGETEGIRVELLEAQGDGHAGLPVMLAPGSYRHPDRSQTACRLTPKNLPFNG